VCLKKGEDTVKKVLLIITAAAVSLLMVGFGVLAIVQTNKCNNLNSQVSKLNAKITDLQVQNKSVQNQISSLEKENETLKAVAATSSKTANDQNLEVSTAVTKTSDNLGSKKTAYLTFDDGPSEITPQLLDELKTSNVKATFFVIGKDTPQRREWLRMEADGGNTIGVHSWTHDYSYIYANEQNFLTDFNEIKDMIVSSTGIEPTFSRFPGGTDNTVSLDYTKGVPIMPTLLKDVESQGITPVDWNVGGMDAVIPVPNKDFIVNGVISECQGRNSVIILLHDSSTHLSSVEAVPEIITKLRALGYDFEPLTPGTQVITRTPAKTIPKVTTKITPIITVKKN